MIQHKTKGTAKVNSLYPVYLNYLPSEICFKTK